MHQILGNVNSWKWAIENAKRRKEMERLRKMTIFEISEFCYANNYVIDIIDSETFILRKEY